MSTDRPRVTSWAPVLIDDRMRGIPGRACSQTAHLKDIIRRPGRERRANWFARKVHSYGRRSFRASEPATSRVLVCLRVPGACDVIGVFLAGAFGGQEVVVT